MKLLLDENISPRRTERLADLYPGSISVLGQNWGGRTDAEIFLHAAHHGFILVSHDSDFRELALLAWGRDGLPVGWVRKFGGCGYAATRHHPGASARELANRLSNG